MNWLNNQKRNKYLYIPYINKQKIWFRPGFLLYKKAASNDRKDNVFHTLWLHNQPEGIKDWCSPDNHKKNYGVKKADSSSYRHTLPDLFWEKPAKETISPEAN